MRRVGPGLTCAQSSGGNTDGYWSILANSDADSSTCANTPLMWPDAKSTTVTTYAPIFPNGVFPSLTYASSHPTLPLNAVTGSGQAIVLATSPILTTPNIGSATGISLALSGTIGTYGNVPTVANGIPSINGKKDSTNNGADITATTAYSVPASGAGMYRVGCYVVETTADPVSATLPACVIWWTDNETNVPNDTGISTSATANTVGAASHGQAVLNVRAGSNIQYSTVGYASHTAGAMKYSIHVTVEYLGN